MATTATTTHRSESSRKEALVAISLGDVIVVDLTADKAGQARQLGECVAIKVTHFSPAGGIGFGRVHGLANPGVEVFFDAAWVVAPVAPVQHRDGLVVFA